MIDSYTFGKFIVDKETYESNIVLLGTKVKQLPLTRALVLGFEIYWRLLFS